MAITAVNESQFEQSVLKSSLPILVDFWAPWCGPCKMAEPILEELSNQYKDKVVIAKVNVDENGSISEKYSVLSIPTTILFKNGVEVSRQIGFSGKKAFEDLILKGIGGE